MKIALLGYGKMGKMIEELAQERGHHIVLRHNGASFIKDFMGAEVAIDFSTPQSAVQNICSAFLNGIPVVSGTTGWLDQMSEVESSCLGNHTAFIYASNFSLGVNLFFSLNKKLAAIMAPHGYKISLEEIHHTQKLDAPSGTAISLAEDIMPFTHSNDWALEGNKTKSVTNALRIKSKRVGNTPGTHSVSYKSDEDCIEIIHTALNRKGFAIGAIVAAEWIKNKKGVFSMSDVLALQP
jgi:4-hydroxy-tetrahydrodipicolinate reductase